MSISSRSQAFTPIFGRLKSAVPLDQSGDWEKVPQPQTEQK